MSKSKSQRELEQLVEPFRVTNGKKFRLADVKTDDTGGIDSKDEGKERLAQSVDRLCDLQKKLYAQNQWSLLAIFQGMDAAGKDGAIAHVMSGINPEGCEVHSFKAPSVEELDHDFLWRTSVRLPARGRIGIFNRSYYEEVLVVRVHPEILAGQKLPPRGKNGDSIWKERFESINALERHLERNGTAVVKFFLHLSKKEQKARFLERLEEPDRRWKFSMGDVEERGHWSEYMAAYEDMIRHTSSEHAPWYVIPADNKWFARLAVSGGILERIRGLGLEYPKIEGAAQRELARVRRGLLGEKAARRRVTASRRGA